MASTFRAIPFILLAFAMFTYPQEVVTAASDGISLWWDFVLPALLPFFILSELLMGVGFVHFLGVLLEPLMRPLFRLPGHASFVVAMSYTSGIPVGAILTTKLRKQNMLTRVQGERLLAFTCNPSPGFLFGALAASMMGHPELGIVLVASIYGSNLLVGLIFRFYRNTPSEHYSPAPPSLKGALAEMKKAQVEDGRSIGQLIGDAVRQSMNTILLVGGFIIFFTVLVHMLDVLNFTKILSLALGTITNGLISAAQASAILNGFLETTLGCRSAIESFSDLNIQIAVVVAMLGWGGLSAFAQVATFTSTTDLRFSPFVIGRVLHGILALVLGQIILKFVKFPASQPPMEFFHFGILESFKMSAWAFCIGMMVLLILSYLFKIQYRR